MNLEAETEKLLLTAEDDLLRINPPLEYQQLKDVLSILTSACMAFVDLTAAAAEGK